MSVVLFKCDWWPDKSQKMPRYQPMPNIIKMSRCLVTLSILLLLSSAAAGQRSAATANDDASSEFGPVMRAYIGYLSNEQEVVDDRASRREITGAYYRRNSSRIRALRQMAIRLVRQSGNDYVPELEAVAVDELGTLFEDPPKPASLHVNEIVANKFKFLATVHTGEVFYMFARLDPYEQAELIQRQTKGSTGASVGDTTPKGQRVGQTTARPRRVVPK
jgi:hypothetical protein